MRKNEHELMEVINISKRKKKFREDKGSGRYRVRSHHHRLKLVAEREKYRCMKVLKKNITKDKSQVTVW